MNTYRGPKGIQFNFFPFGLFVIITLSKQPWHWLSIKVRR